MFNPYQQYRAAAVETAGPIDLVVMLYQGVIRFTQRGIEALAQRDVEESNRCLLRSQEIVSELNASLDREHGGEIAATLQPLYEYSIRRLTEANVKKDPAPAEEVVKIFREMLPSWQTLAAEQRRAPVAQARPAMAFSFSF